MPDDENTAAPQTYGEVEGGPIPGVPDEIQACFPETGMIHAAMWWLVQTGYTDSLHHLMATLPVLAYEMSIRGWEGVGRGRQIALQTLLIGPSGSAKSTALRKVRELHDDVTKQYYGPSWDTRKHDRWMPCEGTTAGVLEMLAGAHVEEWETPNATYQHMDATPAIIYNEEFSSVLGMSGGIYDFLLQLFDASTKVDRALVRYLKEKRDGGKPPATVRKPAISAIYCTTPEALRSIVTRLPDGYLERGLASRMLWAYGKGDSDRLRLDTPGLSSQLREVVALWSRALAWNDAQFMLGSLRHDDVALRVLPISPKVKQLLENYVAETKTAIDSASSRAGTLVRGLNQAQLVAQIYAWSNGQYEVDENLMQRALRLVQLCQASLEHMQDVATASEAWLAQEKLLEAIRQAPKGLTKAQCYAIARCPKAELDAMLEGLRDRSAIDLKIEKPPGGGRATQRWVAIGGKAFKVIQGGKSDSGPFASDEEDAESPVSFEEP